MDGDANIPFAALKESFRYQAFVTNLSPSCSVDAIKGHVNSKLGVNAVIKPVSPAGAPYLSLILLCTSESDKLDLRMDGLWPRGTIVRQCKPPKKKKRNGNTNNGESSSGEQMQGKEQSHQVPVNCHRNDHSGRSVSTENQVTGKDFIHSNQDQQRLHNQWCNQ